MNTTRTSLCDVSALAPRRFTLAVVWCPMLALCGMSAATANVVFDTYSHYHHIQVIDESSYRTLSFNGSHETQMSLTDPLQGHFEYTEYFHMPWLWNHDIKRVMMIGLGGGSTQRSYQHFYTNVVVDTVEVDPAVIDVAKKYFGVTETPRHKINNSDGRVFLRRASTNYDVIIMDAYTTGRYGSSIPPHLVTKEFFKIAAEHLTTNGVLAYNVIGQTRGYRANFVGAMYRTMKEVFPQVYIFPATSSWNLVFIATRSPERFDPARVELECTKLLRSRMVTIPLFSVRTSAFQNAPPPSAATSPVLTDDHAPVESLIGNEETQ